MVAGEFVALLATVTEPVETAAAVGAKTTVKVADWLGVKTVPCVTPLAVKPAPETLTPVMVTFEVPEFVKDTVCVLLLANGTFPKLRLAGLDVKVLAATPFPARLTAVGELGALLTIEILPDTAPTAVGRKFTVTVVCCPALTFSVDENPVLNSEEPLTVIPVMVNVAVPVLVMIKAWEELLLTTSFPKLIELEFTWMPGTGVAFTVSVAAALVTVPAGLLTTTVNADPLSAAVVAGVV
jgi:hypothetical protein